MKQFLLLFFTAVLLTIIFTWPFIGKITTFYYDRGDYQLSGATLSYNEYSFRTGRILDRETYFNGFQFYPQPYTLAYSDLRLVPSLIYAPIYWLSRNFVLSVNLTTFITFVLSFVSAFYMLYFFTRQKLAAILGAIIYTFNPLTFSRLPEHFELLNKYALPLVFLFAYKFITTPNLKNAFLFFLFFTINAFTCIYFQIFTMVTLPIFAFPILAYRLRKDGSRFLAGIFKFSVVFLIFFPLFWYFDGSYLNFSRFEGSTRSITENAYYSARLIDYISSTPQNWLYGPFVQSIEKLRAPREENSPYGAFNYQEHTLFLNVIPMVLFIFSALLFLRRSRSRKMSGERLALAVSFFLLLAAAFIFTFGPYFQGWNSSGGTLKMPFYFLYRLIPFVQGIRAPTRSLFIFYVPFTLFIAFGLSYLFKNIKGKHLAFVLFAVLMAGLWAENFTLQPPNIPYSEKSAILEELSQVEKKQGKLLFLEDKNVLHLPVLTTSGDIESIYLNWAAQTHERLVNGNRGSFLSSDQAPFLKRLDEKVDEETLKELSLLGVDYVIFHKDLLKNNPQKYSQGQELYQKGEAMDNDKVMVVRLKKYGFKVDTCNFDRDIKTEFKTVFLPQNFQNANVLIVKNISDCFLPNIYTDKYKKMAVAVGSLYGMPAKEDVYYKLPPIIGPKQELILSDINGDLRIQ